MARPALSAAQSAFGKARAGSETPEQKVERLRKEVGDYQARERGGHSYALTQPKRSGSIDRQVDPRILRKQYEEDLRRAQLELHQRYEISMQKTHLQYQQLTLELNRQRQLQRDRHRQMEDIFNGSDGKEMTVVTISAIPGARVLDVRGTVTGACTMHALPEDATPDELREAPVNARREAYADLILEARRLGANAIVNFKWRNLHIGYDSVEVTAEGTALKVEAEKQDQHCQQCKGGGKGGKNKDHQHNHQQNQQGGKKGKGKQQNQYDEDTDSEEGDSEEEWNQGQKGAKQKNKNQQQGGGKQKDQGGGKGNKNLSTIEQLVKVLMESKMKDDQKSKAEKQKNDFMNMLGKFFEDQQYNTSKEALFEWTKNFDNDSKSGNSKGQGQSQGQNGNSDPWGGSNNNASGNQAAGTIGWGDSEDNNNASTAPAQDNWGTEDNASKPSNDQKGNKGGQQKGKEGKNNDNKNAQKQQKGNQGGGKSQQKQQETDNWGPAAPSNDQPAQPNADAGWGSPAAGAPQAQENNAWD